MRKGLLALSGLLLAPALVLGIVLLVEALGEDTVAGERWAALGALALALTGGVLALLAERRAERAGAARAARTRDEERSAAEERLRAEREEAGRRREAERADERRTAEAAVAAAAREREELVAAERRARARDVEAAEEAAREAAAAARRERDERVAAAEERARQALAEAEERSRQALAEAEERSRQALAQAAQEREQALAAAEQRRLQEVSGLEAEAERAAASRTTERAVNADLRRQVSTLQRERGTLGDWQDVRRLVLLMAMSLTEAKKGLLLARTDEDGDGDLDLVAHQGFDGDPTHSVLAQRFGRQVLEQDRTVHEDAAASTPEGDDTPADREFENLVAIPIYIADRFSGIVVCANRPGGFEAVEDEVLLALGDHAGAVLENARLHDELRGSYLSTVKMLAEAVQAKDPFLRGHSEAVSGHVAAVAARLGLGDRRREELVFASLLHDVGKIGISERILHKPAALTPEEFAIIRLHPRIGYRLVEQVPSLRGVAPAILHHHERFDGAGYPAGLRGEQIPLEARIIGVADAFSAMTSDRPYRTRMTYEQAFAELEHNAGTQFDAEIVRVFVDEARARPGRAGQALAEALDDAELQLHRAPDEPVLGAGALALTDSLTLLYTHRYLHDAAAAAAERCRAAGPPATFSVVLVQLDEVPLINGTQGFAAGDGHLRAAARVLTRLAARNGATACRENGIVLALLTPAGHDLDADVLVLEAREALRDFGSVRVGGASWREGDDGEAVITRARGGLAVAPLGVDGTV